MKKTKVLVLALVVAVVLTGAGFASWSTKITYNNSMKTAEWNVFVENDAKGDSLVAEDTVQNFNADHSVTGSQTDGYTKYDKVDPTDKSGAKKDKGTNFVYTIEPTITTDVEKDDTVNFAFYNMHPGTSANTRFEIRNAGTIPAKIAGIKVTVNDGKPLNQEEQALYDAMKITGQFMDHEGNNQATIIGTPINTNLAGLQKALEERLLNHQLKEQHSIYTIDSEEIEVEPGLAFAIPANALKVNGKNVGRLAQLKLKIEFNFVQYNQNDVAVK